MEGQLSIFDLGVEEKSSEYKPIFFHFASGFYIGYCPYCKTEVYNYNCYGSNKLDSLEAWNHKHDEYYGKRMCPVCNKYFSKGSLPDEKMPVHCGILVNRWEQGEITEEEVRKHIRKPSKDYTCHEGCCK